MIRFLQKLLVLSSVLIVVSFSGLASWAHGGDVVNNGGGLSENNILYAFTHLKSMVESCLYSKGCSLTVPEQGLLQKIYDHHRSEIGGVRFLSSAENPGFFQVDDSGAPRTAVTGPNVGDPIYFNIERIYPIVQSHIEYVDVLTAAGFLIHELGHHHGVKDHTYLDRLGGKVREFLGSQRWMSLDLKKFKNNPFTVSVFYPKMLHEVNLVPIVKSRLQVSVSNGYEIYDLSPLFKLSSRCTGEETFIESSGTDLNWVPIGAFDSATKTQTIRFQIVTNWDCNPWPQPGLRKHFNQTLEISNRFQIQDLQRVDLFTWKLSDPIYDPAGWRTEADAILKPVSEWQVREVSCETTDDNFNPTGPCEF